MLKSLFSKTTSIPLTKLPSLHAFVDVMVAGRPARQVTVESVGPKGIVTRETLGRAGETAVIVYQASAGRFRAQTKIAAVGNAMTTLEMPRRVSLIGAATGAQKRQTVRLDAIVTGQWRFAPKGVGTGDWSKCTIRDISRGGCALILDRGLKNHTQVEVRMQLKNEGEPLTLLGEVMRHDVIAASGKHSHGLRFHGIRPGEDQAIVEFINRKQAELRSRGLA
jgi:c-di-GMP-binding flagellar brake protein YcgR